MNTLIALACLLAVAHGSAIGYGGYGLSAPLYTPIVAPAAISSANLVKAAPIPVIRTVAAPVITHQVVTAPIVKTIAAPVVSYGGLGGWGGHGLWGGLGHGSLGYGWGGYGYGHGWGGYGLGYGWGKH